MCAKRIASGSNREIVMNDKVRKQSGSSGAKARPAELTCSEGQIEDLLSAGESTENGEEQSQGSKGQGTEKPSHVHLRKQGRK